MLTIQVTDTDTGETRNQALTKDFLESLPQSEPVPPPYHSVSRFVFPQDAVIPTTNPGVEFALHLFEPNGTHRVFNNHSGGVMRDVVTTLAADINSSGGTDPSLFTAVAENCTLTVTCVAPGPAAPAFFSGDTPAGAWAETF